MLEKYLKERGITPEDVYQRFPEVEDSLRNYLSIKEMEAGAEYDDELNKLSSEIVNFLKNNEKAFEKPKIEPKIAEVVTKIQATPSQAVDDDIKIPEFGEEITIPDFGVEIAVRSAPTPKAEIDINDIEIPDMESVSAEEVREVFDRSSGYLVRGAGITPDLWMKILALAGIDYKWKIDVNGNQFWIGDNGYLVTNKNPFEHKIADIWIYSNDDEHLENLYGIVQSKILSYEKKSIPIEQFSTQNLKEAVHSDDIEPVSKLPYKTLDETVREIWNINSMYELAELISLSKKYGCGCGSI